MSDLQFGLLAIGAVVVIAVLAFNKWQEVRFRREAEGSLRSRHDDVLMETANEPPAASGMHGATADRPQSGRGGGRGRERGEEQVVDRHSAAVTRLLDRGEIERRRPGDPSGARER